MSSEPANLDKAGEEEISSGDMGRAEAIAQSIGDPYHQAKALIAISRRALEAGDMEWAERSVNCIANSQLLARAQLELAEMVASAGDSTRAERLLDQAVMTGYSIANPDIRDQTLAEIAQRLARVGAV